ncbi:hypothetical protein RHMOL_Rhmol03G0231700 [Rhododendron molle]|uniref:Uncharacterized protein n=2 Tax=Rhododendron molle TaxID=49168 RepID=A0ACC0PJT9_RHOML|nr:hypothetical protein RHMOL_Rhmol03G0231700 [Rhododendron molle]KAI8565064.1 hypothetical protein RHMOL_Rhmol03G0231700 [Rhododendron molle]
MSGMDSIEGFSVHGYVDYPPTYRHIGSHGPKMQVGSVLHFGIRTNYLQLYMLYQQSVRVKLEIAQDWKQVKSEEWIFQTHDRYGEVIERGGAQVIWWYTYLQICVLEEILHPLHSKLLVVIALSSGRPIGLPNENGRLLSMPDDGNTGIDICGSVSLPISVID